MPDASAPKRRVLRPLGSERSFEMIITRKEQIAGGVVLLTLRDAAGATVPLWEPGSHIDLILGEDLVRQYSLCGGRDDAFTLQVAVLREPDGRGGSEHVHEALHEGDVLRVRGPRNQFLLMPAASYLFIAGGIGITPLLPMITAVAARPDAEWRLLYGGRTRESMAFRADLVERYPDRVEIRPQDEVGLLDLPSVMGSVPAGTAVYSCGPEALLSAVELACAERPELRLHLERFAPKPGALDGPRTSFDVELVRSGTTLTVAGNRSILQTIEAAGIAVLSSCRYGTCGECEVPVIAGIPDHRDSVLTNAEQAASATMMICVSRSRSALLTLDC